MRPAVWLFVVASVTTFGQSRLNYRSLRAGAPLAEFATAVNGMIGADSLRCRTSPRTASLMECGAFVLDGDRQPYVSAFVIAERIAMISVTDSGGPALLASWRDRLDSTYGPGRPTGRGMVEWIDGATVARFTWRGTRQQRWTSLTLTHQPTLAQIDRYLSGGEPRR